MAGEPIQLSRSNVREANQGDVPAIASIASKSFDYPLSDGDIKDALSSRSPSVVLVVEHDAQIVAFMIYNRAPRKATAQVMWLAVTPPYRRRTIGRQLVKWLHRELDAQTKLRIVVQASDNLATHNFLKHVGFHCHRTLPDYFIFGDDTRDDGYEFVYGQKPAPKLSRPRGALEVDLKNRISRYMKGGQCDEDDDE